MQLVKNANFPEFLCESTMSQPGHNEALVDHSCITYESVQGIEKRSSASRYNMTAACQTPAVHRHGRHVRTGRGPTGEHATEKTTVLYFLPPDGWRKPEPAESQSPRFRIWSATLRPLASWLVQLNVAMITVMPRTKRLMRGSRHHSYNCRRPFSENPPRFSRPASFGPSTTPRHHLPLQQWPFPSPLAPWGS